MTASADARLQLIFAAKNLASGAVNQLHGGLSRLKGAAGALGSAVKTMAKVAAVGLAGLAVAAIGLAPSVINLAGKLEQMGQKAATIFGKSLPVVQKWADVNAAKMGLTSRAAVGLAANFADLLIPMGFTRERAAKMSTAVVGLSGALSRWSGGTKTAAEVSEILAKAMLGERDGLKELGISITDADVQARLLKNGTNKLKGAQLEQAKATATQQLIFEKSKDAQTAYAKGSEGLLGVQARLDAKMAQIGETIAIGLTPFLTEVMTFVTDKAIPAVTAIAAKIGKWVDENKPLIKQIGEFVKGALKALWQTISTVVTWIANLVRSIASNKDAMNVLKTLASGIATAFGLAWDAIRSVIGFIAKLVDKITSNKQVMDGFKKFWDGAQVVIGHVVDGLSSLAHWAGEAFDALSALMGLTEKYNKGIGSGSGWKNPTPTGGGSGGMQMPGSVGGMQMPGIRAPSPAFGGGLRVVQLVVSGKVLAEVVDEENYWRDAGAGASSQRG
jgi:hypothetical protein